MLLTFRIHYIDLQVNGFIMLNCQATNITITAYLLFLNEVGESTFCNNVNLIIFQQSEAHQHFTDLQKADGEQYQTVWADPAREHLIEITLEQELFEGQDQILQLGILGHVTLKEKSNIRCAGKMCHNVQNLFLIFYWNSPSQLENKSMNSLYWPDKQRT